MSKGRRVAKVVIPILIVAVGIAVLAALVKGRRAPARAERQDAGALVRVMEVGGTDYRVSINATGTVRSSQVITVIPQVSGPVSGLSGRFVTGGFFRAGETFFEIDDTDYRLAVERAEAARASAEYELARVESQARVARTEWDRLAATGGAGGEGIDGIGEPNSLVVYGPQLKNAEAALAGAEAALEQARVDRSRTMVRAPFNCRVSTEEVDLGQYVRSGTPVATVSGTDEAEVEVALPLDRLQWIGVPSGDGRGGKPGSRAEVRLGMYGRAHTWAGRVARSVGEVDARDRMMHLVVTVPDPYRLDGPGGGGAGSASALPSGAFVEVSMEGSLLEGVFVIPRSAYRDDSTVWTVDADNRLRIRKVVAVFMERERVVISEGLAGGDVIITSPLTGAADGLKLRVSSPVTAEEAGK